MLRAHDDHDHHGHHPPAGARKALADAIWRQESVDLTTVGIDIGSSTSHLIFARVLLQRRARELSSRFEVVQREIVWRSPITLTPFLRDGSIDAPRLESFIHRCYHQAGLQRSDVDSGAVILTGEAIKQRNARVIDELFAEEAGKFVCATAGHKLEAALAAHGSGAVALSRERDEVLLHADIGGGTTKLALIDRGRVLGVCAFAVGGRLLATDAAGQWTRVDDSARRVAAELGLGTTPAILADPGVRERIAARLADVATDYIAARPLDRLGLELQLTEALPREPAPTALSVSGGVSEYLLGRERAEYGDIALLLAAALRERLAERVALPLLDPGQGIRATVIGASQFTVQVSGKTIYLSDAELLPVHNVPVVHPDLRLADTVEPAHVAGALRESLSRLDLAPEASVALALHWRGDPSHERLAALGRGLLEVLAPGGTREAPLLLVIDGDVGNVLGHVLHRELGYSGELFSIDGVRLREFDYVDVGSLIDPPGVVPVVIKSLIFS